MSTPAPADPFAHCPSPYANYPFIISVIINGILFMAFCPIIIPYLLDLFDKKPSREYNGSSHGRNSAPERTHNSVGPNGKEMVAHVRDINHKDAAYSILQDVRFDVRVE